MSQNNEPDRDPKTGNRIPTHDMHRTEDGLWMFQSKGVWHPFHNDQHFINTRDQDFLNQYPIAFFKKVCDLPRG